MLICNIVLIMLCKSELMDIISRDWVLLCDVYQVFTAADFSCCLFVALSVFSLVFSEWNAARSGWDQEIDSAVAEYYTFYLHKLLGCLCCMFWVIVHLYSEAPLNQLCCMWLNLSREYISIHFRIDPSASVFCLVITKHFCLLSHHH